MDNSTFLKTVVYKKGGDRFRFYFITIGMCLVIAGIYLVFDRLFPFSQAIGEFVVMFIGIITLGGIYRKKEKYIDKFGKLEAYRKAFYRFHVTTMPFIYVSALHPLFAYYTTSRVLPLYVSIPLGVYFLLSALLLHRKTIKIFGIANLFMYYVYFPEESVMVESVIHSLIRHPVYSAMSRISIGTGVLIGTAESMILGLILPIMQACWIYFYEEKELKKRFGDSYRQYITSTPAVWNKMTNISKFWKFLLVSEHS